MDITWYDVVGWFKKSRENPKTGVCSSIHRKVPPCSLRKDIPSRRHLPFDAVDGTNWVSLKNWLWPDNSVGRTSTDSLGRSVVASIVAAVLVAVGAASRSINSRIIDLLDNPPSAAYALLLVLCLLPVLDFGAALALLLPGSALSILVAKAAEQDVQSFPTKAGGTEQRTLTGKKMEELKEMCRDYGLFVSGTKPVLLTRLREFSNKFYRDPTSCDLSVVKRRTKKGPRDDPKKSQPKQSANRRAAIIDTERVTERSKDTRTVDEIQDLMAWADHTVVRLAYKPPKPQILPEPSSQVPDCSLHDRIQLMDDQLAAITTSRSSALAQWTPVSPAPVAPAEYIVYDHTTESV
ncbi:hypothetical protein DFH08DRAFT_1029660 [Mycena albidolilacea]|uniref:SAP domain-containing protein n=1 Tax=Mycena albidolilacea TaxID=1033008 RepID=A0AAD6ZHJ7_9AGAR|nr:hypothetical protein DFH08DRAFT_1029660 [Mycena albidolilacea]